MCYIGCGSPKVNEAIIAIMYFEGHFHFDAILNKSVCYIGCRSPKVNEAIITMVYFEGHKNKMTRICKI